MITCTSLKRNYSSDLSFWGLAPTMLLKLHPCHILPDFIYCVNDNNVDVHNAYGEYYIEEQGVYSRDFSSKSTLLRLSSPSSSY